MRSPSFSSNSPGAGSRSRRASGWRPVFQAIRGDLGFEAQRSASAGTPARALWSSWPLDRPSLVGRDPVLQIIHEAVELGVRDRAVHPAVALCGIAVEVVGTDDNLECSRTAHKRGQPLARTAARHDACANFELRPLELAQSRTIHLHLGADVVSLRRAGHLRCRA